jgi:DNA-binding CsgD family transcriptional regulator
MEKTIKTDGGEVLLLGGDAPPDTSAAPFDIDLSLDRVLNIAADLSAIGDATERNRLVRGLVRMVGFEGLGYGHFARIGPAFHRVIFYRTFAMLEFARRYFERRYFEVDPRLQIVCEREWPLVWDLDLVSRSRHFNRADPRAREFLADAEASGVRSGVMFGIAASGGIARTAVLSFYSSAPGRSRITDAMVGQAYALGTGLHEFMTHRSRSAPLEDVAVPLTKRQRDILSRMIRGQSDTEIAEELGTTPHNVDYHLRQLRKKYNVQNRAQLAYVVGRLELI